MPKTMIDYATGSQRPSQAWLICGITACCVAVAAIIAPIPSIAEVASYPPGTSMRPMGAAAMLLLGGAAGMLAVLPLALYCLVRGRHTPAGLILGAVGLLLGVIAVFGDTCVFNYIVTSRGYLMEP